MISINRKQLFFGYLLFVGIAMTLFLSELAGASEVQTRDVLIKVASQSTKMMRQQLRATSEDLGGGWIRVRIPATTQVLKTFAQNPDVEFVQPNFKLGLLTDYRIQNQNVRNALIEEMKKNPRMGTLGLRPDNPAIPAAPALGSGPDPLFKNQWGMIDNKVQEAWNITKGDPRVIVAVIDTGVDYTHEDLLPNLWRNEKEIPNNNVDDDNNGYVDDIVGWDFAGNDNKPYDLAVDDPLDLLTGGGNPGHGTHCAGNVAARGNNGIGVAGVAPNVKIMSLRFISEKGTGTTADAVKSIRYAVDNGAQILSNSWGGEGQDDSSAENLALKEAIQYAMEKDVLFVAAAGNGRNGRGYNNDTDKNPVYPASYNIENIITVAALDNTDKLGAFSNFGAKTVHIGAPGVKVYSTTVANQYSDIVIDKFGFKATWDGTSMAAPHVAGAAALYLSANPRATFRDMKTAILRSATKIPSMTGKAVSEGKLNVLGMMK